MQLTITFFTIILAPTLFVALYALWVKMSPLDRKFRSLPYAISISRILLALMGLFTIYGTISGWLIALDIILIPNLVVIFLLYKFISRRYQEEMAFGRYPESVQHRTLSALAILLVSAAIILLLLRKGNIV